MSEKIKREVCTVSYEESVSYSVSVVRNKTVTAGTGKKWSIELSGTSVEDVVTVPFDTEEEAKQFFDTLIRTFKK